MTFSTPREGIPLPYILDSSCKILVFFAVTFRAMVLTFFYFAITVVLSAYPVITIDGRRNENWTAMAGQIKFLAQPAHHKFEISFII